MKIIKVFQFLFSFVPKPLQKIINFIIDYIVNKPNPIIQLFYCLLVLSIIYFYTEYGVNKFFPHRIISNFFVSLFYLLIFNCLVIFVICCIADPGVINSVNIQTKKTKYPYPSIFNNYQIKECKKCGIDILPRSLHCRICNVCIEKFDHHCVWINKCIGAKNYRYFLLYLITNSFASGYGALLGFIIIYYYIIDNRLFYASYYNKETGEQIKTSWITICKYILFQHNIFVFTVVLLFAIFIVLTPFIFYHFYLIYLNLTNEEKRKQAKTINTMNLIYDLILKVAKFKSFKLYVKELTSDEINKYRHLAFEVDSFDLDLFTEEEVNCFYNFSLQTIFAFKKNNYYKGFFRNIINVIKGQ